MLVGAGRSIRKYEEIFMRIVLEIRPSAKIERIEAMVRELNKRVAHDFNDVVEKVKTDMGVLEGGDN
jgi:hypothetical protein